ncbi:MAG TPA: hypothetical protein V6D25_18460 [Leptolyngbyaceae cyanobacterium]
MSSELLQIVSIPQAEIINMKLETLTSTEIGEAMFQFRKRKSLI